MILDYSDPQTRGRAVSKTIRILVLLGLVVVFSTGFQLCKDNDHPQAAMFFAVMMLGALVGIPVVAFLRRTPRRRG